jgi:hypothetical protein
LFVEDTVGLASESDRSEAIVTVITILAIVHLLTTKEVGRAVDIIGGECPETVEGFFYIDVDIVGIQGVFAGFSDCEVLTVFAFVTVETEITCFAIKYIISSHVLSIDDVSILDHSGFL